MKKTILNDGEGGVMTPEHYNYEWERTRRANMTPWEVIQEMSPALVGLVMKWQDEDAKEPTAPKPVDEVK